MRPTSVSRPPAFAVGVAASRRSHLLTFGAPCLRPRHNPASFPEGVGLCLPRRVHFPTAAELAPLGYDGRTSFVFRHEIFPVPCGWGSTMLPFPSERRLSPVPTCPSERPNFPLSPLSLRCPNFASVPTVPTVAADGSTIPLVSSERRLSPVPTCLSERPNLALSPLSLRSDDCTLSPWRWREVEGVQTEGESRGWQFLDECRL